MPGEIDKIIDTYATLEADRKTRNNWIKFGIGGAAVGALVGIASGHLDIGLAVGAFPQLAAVPMGLDAQEAVDIDRRNMLIHMSHQNQPESITVIPLSEA